MARRKTATKIPTITHQLIKRKPQTKNQNLVFKYFDDYNLVLHGCAGTGKTFVALYLSLANILDEPSSSYSGVTIIRSAVATRNLGYLPGSAKEKMADFEHPYYQLCEELFNREDSFRMLVDRDLINFESTSFLRGTTYRNRIIIVDECSNMSFHELDTIITRIGENCKLIFCGDFHQSDLRSSYERHGFPYFMKILETIESFKLIEFTEDDIIRSDLVKDYIIAKRKFGHKKEFSIQYTDVGPDPSFSGDN